MFNNNEHSTVYLTTCPFYIQLQKESTLMKTSKEIEYKQRAKCWIIKNKDKNQRTIKHSSESNLPKMGKGKLRSHITYPPKEPGWNRYVFACVFLSDTTKASHRVRVYYYNSCYVWMSHWQGYRTSSRLKVLKLLISWENWELKNMEIWGENGHAWKYMQCPLRQLKKLQLSSHQL